jgi:Phosphotransferase enzyme family
MNELLVQKAATQFGNEPTAIKALGSGLIHHTYCVHYKNNPAVVLQAINKNTFTQPENIIQNYCIIQNYLNSADNSNAIAGLVTSKNGTYFWEDEAENFWRATLYIENSYAPENASSPAQAQSAANCFASFTQQLAALDADKLFEIIPHFHNLAHRYQQFETAIKGAAIFRLMRATHVISELRNRHYLVNFYNRVTSDAAFKKRVMHHDCKPGNILFDAATHQAICPVDLDTVMPGYFFSDIGDMIRTMACTHNENSNEWEHINVNGDYYNAIMKGYLQGMKDSFTTAEIKHIHKAGLLMTYMQCLRFTTDFLNNDIYYKTTYPEQNLNRSLNQLIYLEQLEAFTAGL